MADGMRLPAPAPSPEEEGAASSSDDEMELQLREHAALAYNEFVRQFHRKAGERIAANRMFISTHLRKREPKRSLYPVEVSAPFIDAWQNVARAHTSEPATAPARVRKTAKCDIRTTSESLTLTRQAVVLPRVPPVPNSTMWTALTKNYDVEDQPQLKFLPYFGDDDDDDVVSDFFQVSYVSFAPLPGTSASEMDFTTEMCEAILSHLQLTWELTDTDLQLIAKTIQVDEKVVVEVHKHLQAPLRPAKKAKRTDATPSNEAPRATGAGSAAEASTAPFLIDRNFQQYDSAIDSYRSLFCRRCYVYDCDYHGCREVAKLDIREQNAVYVMNKSKAAAAGTGKNCGNQCFLGQTQPSGKFSKARAISTAFGWDRGTQIACVRAYFICAGNFCDIAKMLGTKTCLEVAEFCDANEINDHTLALVRKSRTHSRKVSKNKKNKFRPSIAHLQQIESGPMNVIPSVITPCAHTGSCEDNRCACFEDGRFCSKLCSCVHEECKIFFAGCRCVRGRCKTKACPCFAAGRECDLDLCSVCGAEDTAAALVSLESDDVTARCRRHCTNSSSTSTCHNRNLGGGKRKHVRVGRSVMENAGWGLFVDDYVAKDEFIIEYIGEMVTQEEAERRGAVYDKVNRSYLFNLDTETVIDATRKGNKTRFINHSSRPNCYSKIININSDYRIGIYAGREIKPHEELFFDYGYEKDLQHEHLHKQPTITEWMKQRPLKQ